MGFLVICLGITILQLSKVDPNEFKKLDRKSTILLQATRARTDGFGDGSEKGLVTMEDPGVDSIRGSFGTVGSIIRARTVRKMSMGSSADAELRTRMSRGHRQNIDSADATPRLALDPLTSHFGGLKRHQLYDAPVPSQSPALEPPELLTHIEGSPSRRQQTIKFGDRDVVHSYARVGGDDDRSPVHEYRDSNVPLPGISPPFRPDDPFASMERLPPVAVSPPEISPSRSSDPLGLPPDHRGAGSSTQNFRPPSAKKYPRGNEGDDADESEFLWRTPGSRSDEESEIGLNESQKGIRLVTKSRT